MYKKSKSILILGILLAITFFSSCAKNDTPTGPQSDPQFKNLEEEIDHIVNQYYKVGAAVGVINKQQEQLVSFYGTKVLNADDPPNENTVFQIGSITKTFTTTLFADRILKGIVGLDSAASQYLPADQVTMPTYDGAEITLKHLATHSSGIPKKPHGTSYPYPPGYDLLNAYAAYTKEHIYDFLTNYCTLSSKPGTRYLYSNIGVGLLGHILGIVDGSSYEELLINIIINPLGMNNTSLFIIEGQDINIALGYSAILEPMPNFDANDIFQGAGFIKSSLNDMMIYLKANMRLIDNTLENAIDLAQQAHFNVGTVTYDDRPGEVFELTIGLGWHRHQSSDGRTYYWHGGSTNGHTAYIGFDKSNLTGVVVLCNCEDVNILIFGDKLLKAINKY